MKNLARLLSIAVVSVLIGCATDSATSAGARPYPLTTCLVTDNELGSMGTPVRLVHEGQVVKLCCKPCVKKFNADPARYLAKLG